MGAIIDRQWLGNSFLGRPVALRFRYEDLPKTDPPKADDPPKTDEDPPADTPKTFTLTEAQIKKRAEQEARRLFPDYDQLKDRAAKADQLEASLKSDQEKAIDAAKAEAKKEADDAAAVRISDAEARANRRLVRAEIVSEAGGRFHDNDLVWSLLQPEITGDAPTITVEGEGDDAKIKGVKAAIDKLAKDRPYLLKAAGSSIDTPNPGDGNSKKTPEKQKEDKDKAIAESTRNIWSNTDRPARPRVGRR